MIIVPRIQTKISTKDAISGLVYGWNEVVKTCPAKEAIGILVAQWAFETGWGKFCWNFNLGNHRIFQGYSGKAIELPTADEWVNGKHIIQGGYFQAFDSVEEGGLAHIKLLFENPRYSKAKDILIENPVPEEFVHAIKQAGYFTGDEKQYASGVGQITKSVIGLMEWDCNPKTIADVIWEKLEKDFDYILEKF